MPWHTESPMSQRLEFVRAVLHRSPGASIRDICRASGISEKTGHKWLERYGGGGPSALADRSHAPHTPAHQVPQPLVAAILAVREDHPTWGARKLREVLRHEQPAHTWPAASTITTLLGRAGMLTRRRRSRRERAAWAHTPLTRAQAPNDVWAADFKGEFRLERGPYCYPLTLSDLHSRYVLAVEALPGTAHEPAQAHCQRCFEQYGLPRVIRTDNGVPFGAPAALGGLSPLAVWWIRLGIRPERIEPGAPQQNAAHERMHRTLKAEATRPPSATFTAQQQRFTAWRRTFNEQRPHEALAGARPADHYRPSPRPFPRRLPLLEYPAHTELRRVMPGGCIRWRGLALFLSTVLAGEYVSLAETAHGEWTIAFGPLTLGTYSAHTLAFTDALAWTPTPE
ncbi:MAG: integrase core domain-containing protein [Gemmatimonadaceae bacterium]